MRLWVAVLSIMLKLQTVEFLSNKLKPRFDTRWTFYGRFSMEISKAH